MVVTYKTSTTANMKIADFREIVTTVPFTSTITKLNYHFRKKRRSDNFCYFEQSLVVDTVLATHRFL